MLRKRVAETSWGLPSCDLYPVVAWTIRIGKATWMIFLIEGLYAFFPLSVIGIQVFWYLTRLVSGFSCSVGLDILADCLADIGSVANCLSCSHCRHWDLVATDQMLGGLQTCWSWNVRESVTNELVSAQGILVKYLQCGHEQIENQKNYQEI